MNKQSVFTLHERRWTLGQDDGGHAVWQEEIVAHTIQAGRTAIIICDMWDRHWSRGAAERVDAMAPRMNGVLKAARNKGALIIHAPSDTLSFYEDAPARRRMLALDPKRPPQELELPVPPLPIDDSDGGSDTGELEVHYPWTRQHAAIEIDDEHDLISDNGLEVYAALDHYGIEQAIIMGVHTNMCVLNRSFAIKQLVRWNVPVVLVHESDRRYVQPGHATLCEP